jgi:predicted O-methyltransferase YrrM
VTPTDTPSFADALDLTRDVEGWMTHDQAQRLWDRASEVDDGGRIVEIGSFRGRSTIVLATAAGRGVDVVAIDPHAGNDRGPNEITGFEAEARDDRLQFHRNLVAAGVADRVRHIPRFSNAALGEVPGAVDLLYVDGAHRWRPAAADLRDWGSRVPEGHVMLIHDSFSSVGVTAAIATELLLSPHWRYEGRSQSMTQYRRIELQGPERRENIRRQLREVPWFLRNLLIKLLIVLGLRKMTRHLGNPSGEWPY